MPHQVAAQARAGGPVYFAASGGESLMSPACKRGF